MESPSDRVVTVVGCTDVPNYLANAEPGQKKVLNYLKNCFIRKLEEEKRWKVSM